MCEVVVMREKPLFSKLYLRELSNHLIIKLINKFIYIKQIITVFLLTLLVITSSHATNNWRDELPNARVLGSGDFHWFGFKIYHAKLWSQTTPLDMTRPFALQLTYNRSISRRLLVKTVISEMKRLNGNDVTAVKIQDWQNKLTIAIPDISPGDELIGVFLPAQGFRLYSKHGLAADIRDPELAYYFFGVWLDKQAKDSVLRSKLIGITP